MKTNTDTRAPLAGAKPRHSTSPIEVAFNPDAPRAGLGIYSLSDLRDRCRIDGETECWHWGLSTGGQKGGMVPRVSAPAGVFSPSRIKTISGGRAAWLMAGKTLRPGWVVWRTCLHDDCINPAHLKAGTKAQEGAWMAANAGRKGDPRRAATNRLNVGAQVVPAATVQQIAEMVANGVMQAEICALTGVHKATISKIANGRHYHQRTSGLVRGASVFALGAQA